MSARILGIPVFLQESDITPGMASRQIAPYALEIFTSFPKTEFFPRKRLLPSAILSGLNCLKAQKKARQKLIILSAPSNNFCDGRFFWSAKD